MREAVLGALGAPGRPAARPAALPRLPEPAPIAPPCRHSAEPLDRVQHAAGRSAADLVRLRFDRLRSAPDAVAWPESAEQLRAVLEWAAREGVAVVPFGGGTSVVGGVEARRGPHRAALCLDLGGLGRVLDLDAASGLARAQCGVFGPALERELSARGFSLGHFPQSFEFSTLGGWIATRSAGQASTRYGKIEHLVRGLRAFSPAGEFVVRDLPATATGPELREVLVGSEGTLGVIAEATVQVHRKPQAHGYRTFLLESFAAGIEVCRTLLQEGARPAVLRLSDEPETRLQLAATGKDKGLGAALLSLVGKRRLLRGAFLLASFEGSPETVKAEGKLLHRAVERAGANIFLGAGPGRRWEKDRFRHPYLRDSLLDLGILVETLETAAPWSRLPELHAAVRAAVAKELRAAGAAREEPPVLAHLSHAYPDGASLYFTYFADAPDPDQTLELLARVKAASCEAILANGGTVSHHHGAGLDHQPWLAAERGEGQVQLLKAIKDSADPAGIMNPGKLLP